MRTGGLALASGCGRTTGWRDRKGLLQCMLSAVDIQGFEVKTGFIWCICHHYLACGTGLGRSMRCLLHYTKCWRPQRSRPPSSLPPDAWFLFSFLFTHPCCCCCCAVLCRSGRTAAGSGSAARPGAATVTGGVTTVTVTGSGTGSAATVGVTTVAAGGGATIGTAAVVGATRPGYCTCAAPRSGTRHHGAGVCLVDGAR